MKRARSDSEGASPEIQKRVKSTEDSSVSPPRDGKADEGALSGPAEATVSDKATVDGSPQKTAEDTKDVNTTTDDSKLPSAQSNSPDAAADESTGADSKPPSQKLEQGDSKATEKSDDVKDVDDQSNPEEEQSRDIQEPSKENVGDKATKADESSTSAVATEKAPANPGAPSNLESTTKSTSASSSVENADSTKDKAGESKPSTFSAFSGSSGFSGFSSFSNSKFQSIAKSNTSVNPWAEPKATTDEKKPEEEQTKSSTPLTDDASTASFEKQDLITGEEDELTEYSVKVRLYAVNLDSEEKSWKERGVGSLKLNSSHKDKSKKRLLMRADSVLRVSLNLPLVKNTQIAKGFHSSLHTEKFLRISSIEGGHAHQFAFKLGSEEARDRLFDELERALSEI